MSRAAEQPQKPAPRALDEQLASVMEGEGAVTGSADGIQRSHKPTHVDAASKPVMKQMRRRGHLIAGGDRRRQGKKAYAHRPAVSRSTAAERFNDEVANLDRVVVGFGVLPVRRSIKRASIRVRAAEHLRSPFVVSLRGIVVAAPNRPLEDRIALSALARHQIADTDDSRLGVLEALAFDLCMEDPDAEYVGQFTPANFTSAYGTSYGAIGQAALTASSATLAVFRRIRLPVFSIARSRSASRPKIGKKQTRDARPFSFRLPSVRVAIGVIALLIVATLPANAVRLFRSFETTKATATLAGSQGLAEATAAASAPLPESVEAFRRASARFREADEALGSTNALAVGLASLLPQTRSAYRTAKALTEIGSKTADAGRLLATGLSNALGSSAASPLERLRVFTAYAEGALPLLEDASAAFQRVDVALLPEADRAKAAALAQGLDDGRTAVREFMGLSGLLGNVLGDTEPRRYLLIFQNPAELRATGGFMGSFAEVTLDRGVVTRLSVPSGGTYALQGELTARVAPPAPLGLIADRWEFQDANWSPDFPMAADKLRFFWSKAGGPTVDGIIAVNATLVPKLLALTGPIDVPELGKTITADNFMVEVQKSVELEYDRTENQPKKILGLMAPRLIEQLKALPHEHLATVLALLSEGLQTKDIQLSMSNPDAEAQVRRYGWSGELKPASGDALAIIGTNIAGQKTDLTMKERVEHEATIGINGQIEDSVTLTREHTASKGELFRGVRNVTYFRVYVPRGSTLLSAQGFTAPDPLLFKTPQEGLTTDPDQAAQEQTLTHDPSGLDVWDEGDRTVFGGWSMVDPGQTKSLQLRYRLPFTAYDIRSRLNAGPSESEEASKRAAYSLLLTSQSGKSDRRITSRVTVPEAWHIAWSRAPGRLAGVTSDPSSSPSEAAGIEASTAWDRDTVVAALYDIPAE